MRKSFYTKNANARRKLSRGVKNIYIWLNTKHRDRSFTAFEKTHARTDRFVVLLIEKRDRAIPIVERVYGRPVLERERRTDVKTGPGRTKYLNHIGIVLREFRFVFV